jgi:hypothetical protein
MSCFRISTLALSVTAGLVLSACAANVKPAADDTGLDMDDVDAADDDGSGFDWPGDDDDDDPRDNGASNMAPSVVITAPADGDVFQSGDGITFLATVSDDNDNVSELMMEWHSDVIGMLNDDPSGSTEVMFTTEDLLVGRHVISLEATDSDGAMSSSTVMITIEGENDDDDPIDDDDDDDSTDDPDDSDGDGWTTDEGDCDDDNWWTYPGAEEYCDGVDNNCDGNTDEPFWDDYEYNNVLGAAIDLGELDHDGLTTELYSVELTDLTLHEEGDEDWFRFDADDDLYDDIDITVIYEGDSEANVTMQLFKLDWDSTIPWLEISGAGELILEEFGSTWDSGEDRWAIRIFPTDASGADCSAPYTLHIEA